MATQLENVTRRNFLSGTAGAISGAVLLPRAKVQEKTPELEQIAQALHETVGRYSDKGGYVEVCSEDRSITLEMEILRPCSVHEIQDLLMPLFGGVS